MSNYLPGSIVQYAPDTSKMWLVQFKKNEQPITAPVIGWGIFVDDVVYNDVPKTHLEPVVLHNYGVMRARDAAEGEGWGVRSAVYGEWDKENRPANS